MDAHEYNYYELKFAWNSPYQLPDKEIAQMLPSKHELLM